LTLHHHPRGQMLQLHRGISLVDFLPTRPAAGFVCDSQSFCRLRGAWREGERGEAHLPFKNASSSSASLTLGLGGRGGSFLQRGREMVNARMGKKWDMRVMVLQVGYAIETERVKLR